MYIEEIALEGFKSYAQRTVVSGFDPKFNAITGLNGSGKSNILDSICFVLGITNLQQVRAGTLQELVYKQGQAGVQRATVSIVFNNSDKSSSPVGFEDCSKITVTRQIVIGGRNKYLINGHVAQPNRVQNLFHSVQLNVNNPHFLIMQGRITKVLNMKPPEILSMLEEAAGTRMYEVKKEAALKTLDKKQMKVDEINKILTEEIMPALEKLRKERAAYQRWLQGTSEIDRLKRFCTAYEYVLAVAQRDQALQTLQDMKDRVNELEQEQVSLEKETLEKQGQLSSLTAEKEKRMGHEMKEVVARADALSKELVKLTAVFTNKKDSLSAEDVNKRKILQSIEELKQGTSDKMKRVKAAEELVAKAQAHADKTAEELQNAEAEFEAVQAGKSGHPGEDKSMSQALADAKAGAVAAATEIKQMALRITHLEKELNVKSKALGQKQKESTGQQKALDKMEAEVAGLRERLQGIGHDEARAQELEQVQAAEEPAVQALRQKVGQAAAEINVNFMYRDPEPNFDRSRVKGVLARLFSMKDASMATALEVVAGGKLYNVVLDSEQTGKQLLSNGGLQRRTTFVPLNKIEGKTISSAVVEKAKRLVGADNVWPALSLVDYPNELAPAMKYAFGGHFVCRDSETAKKVAFHPEIKTACVTVEGDSFNPSGLLTGGSRRQGGMLLSRLAKLRQDEAMLAEKQALLERSLAELRSMAALRKQYKQASADLEIKTHKLALLKEQMEQSEVQQLAAEVANMQAEVEAAKAGKEEAAARVKAMEERAAQLEKDIARMGKERGQRLKELEERSKKAKKDAAAAAKTLQSQVTEKERLQLDLQAVEGEENSLKEQLSAAEAEMQGIASSLEELAQQVAELNEQHTAADSEVKARKAAMASCDEQLKALEKELADVGERRSNGALELKKLAHQLKQREAEQQGGVRLVEKMLRQHEWIATERGMFGRPGSEYDFKSRDPEAARTELAERTAEQENLEKKVNKKVMTMFERAEQECRGLEKRRETVLKDKSKIQEAIGELDEKKKEALQKTWEKVTKDFGAIFSTLLPGTTAKLDPPEGEDFLSGLEVKVAFGGVWKESLSELSGGQRSLLALSLILALLLFKPAPLYILDEVDAALDLSHTQNIGRMIKNHFPHSQFVVVSLKEGMFNNADVIFRTKFVDGVSTVSRTVPAKQRQDDSDKREKAKAGAAFASARSGAHKENMAPVNV